MRFILAITAHGQGRLMGQRGQQIQQLTGRRLAHLGLELAPEHLPGLGILRSLGLGHQLCAGRQQGLPDIIKVPTGEFGFRYATGRAAYRAQAQAFVRSTG
ncbi:hypothetical protein D3C87_1609470 [compost metagenome]